MSNLCIVRRLKQWTSRAEREEHSDWVNPAHLNVIELLELCSLLASNVILGSEDFVKADRAGTIMLIARILEGHVTIAGYASMTVAVLPDRTVGYVSGPYVKGVDEIDMRLREEIQRIATEAGVDDLRFIPNPSRRPPLRSDISEIDRADRMDGPYPVQPTGREEDGS